MPTISYFRGIKIYINWNDHMPPHFHATYAGEEIIVSIDAGVISYSTLKLSKMMNKTVNWYINRGFSQKMAEYFVSGRRTILDVKANQDF